VPSNSHELPRAKAVKPQEKFESSVQLSPTLIAANPKELEKMLQHSIETEESIPDGLQFKETIGKTALMYPRTYATRHPAGALLNQYADKGCPVDCGIPWTKEHIIKALRHGPHNSAQGKLARQALITEAHNKVQNCALGGHKRQYPKGA